MFIHYVKDWYLFLLLNIFRDQEDECKNAQRFKSEIRSKLISKGYRIVGIIGDQWSSIEGLPSAKRSFKLPNPMYYVA